MHAAYHIHTHREMYMCTASVPNPYYKWVVEIPVPVAVCCCFVRREGLACQLRLVLRGSPSHSQLTTVAVALCANYVSQIYKKVNCNETENGM